MNRLSAAGVQSYGRRDTFSHLLGSEYPFVEATELDARVGYLRYVRRPEAVRHDYAGVVEAGFERALLEGAQRGTRRLISNNRKQRQKRGVNARQRGRRGCDVSGIAKRGECR